MLLAVIAITMGILAYRISLAVEDNKFEAKVRIICQERVYTYSRSKLIVSTIAHQAFLQFDGVARQVIAVSQINAMNIFQQYQTIALQLTAHGLHTTSTTWPYVRLPYF